jgi:LysM repeat protein
MVRVRFIILLLVVCQAVRSQTGLIIQGASPDLHLVHTVVAKENWYSIGRIYNLSPKELAPYNKASLEKPLNIGQLLRIPLTATNFSQTGGKSADESLIPLYHIVQEKEGMYRVSVTHNKVSAENLKKWNSLTSDQLKNGMKLVVGYLKVKGDQTPFASAGSNKITVGNSTVAGAPSVTNPSSHSSTTNGGVKPGTGNSGSTAPASTSPASTTAGSTTPASTTTGSTTPASTSPASTTSASTSTSSTVPPTVLKGETSASSSEPAARPDIINTSAPANYKGGFFKSQYAESGKSTTGNGGVFKSTSGWSDGKYYALMNNVPIGTIVKVTFSSTNKSVYAKVLGQLPEMKESVGLAIRLSDAAASELGVSISKFYVDVKY